MLNEKHIEGELEHIKCASHYKKNVLSNYRKQRYELVDGKKRNRT